ncbi:FAD/NAD(P)-binding domain-containing protein [Cylindrobasidium torrendii FP15055 ss-10]|uniref:FAD/NAD(P)-binding domain-containing protein n=1 Tax=Cylindrobasidium torrendii FP15055 ss-10 TaxID=1314674 RepID=A0A0D7B653_9AGAR|nr:FAD/NAD(P)-binding domain-containing protein [Cylindrobasidium torrendii FP15055 ss-10]
MLDKFKEASQKMHFIIVGASIAGLSAGGSLARCGHTVTILEGDTQDACENRPDIGGVGLPPNATRLLLQVPGALKYLEAHGTQINELKFNDLHTNEPRGRIAFDTRIISDLGAPYYLISHHLLTGFLRSFALSTGCKFRYGFRVASVHTERTGPAVVFGQNGERLECDVIVGADGTSSVVRDYLYEQQQHHHQPEASRDDDDCADSDDENTSTSKSASYLPGRYSRQIVGGVAMIPVEKLEADPELAPLLTTKSLDAYMGEGFCFILGRFGSHYSFNMASPREANPNERDIPWRTSIPAHEHLAQFVPKDNARLQRLFSMCTSANYSVQTLKPLTSFVDMHGRAIVVGTAAHCAPVHAVHTASLPIEDCFTLARLLERGNKISEENGLSAREMLPLLLRGYNEIRTPRSFHLSDSDLLALTMASLRLPEGPMRNALFEVMKASLTAKSADEVGDNGQVAVDWVDWVEKANYDAQDAVDEWWLNYGQYAVERH